MATVQELERAFLNAHNAGDKQAAQALAGALKSAMAAQPAEPAPPKKEPETGFVAGIKSGYEKLKGDIGAIAATTGLEGAEEYAAKQREKAGEIYRQPEFTEKPVEYVTGLLGQSLPYMVAPIAGAVLAPEALGVAGAMGLSGLASATQFTGSNISRQLEEGVSAKNAKVVNAMAAAVPQAALDIIGFKFMPAISKLFSKAGTPLTEEAATTILGKYILPAAKTAGVEGATEAGQQVLERAQAGLSITDPEARKEYFDSFVGGAILGGALAVPGAAIERAQARGRKEKQPEELQQAVTAEPAAEEPVRQPRPAPQPTAKVEEFPPAAEPKISDEEALRARAEAPPVPEAEFVQGEPAPLTVEEENRRAAMEESEAELIKEKTKLSKQPEKGKSLWSAMQGNLTLSDYAEIGRKGLKNLKAPKGMGKSISELAADGSLNTWLPPELQMTKGQGKDIVMMEGEELTKAKAADEYIKNRLSEGNYLTWAANDRLKQIGTSLEEIESSYREIADVELANRLFQEAYNEQRAIDQEVEGIVPERTDGGIEPPANVLEQIPEEPVEEEYYPDKNLKYVQAQAGERGLGKDMVDQVVNSIKPTWKNAPEINVVQSTSELPPEIIAQMERDQVNPRGLFDPASQSVYLVADNIRDQADAAITLAHESLGHFGLRSVLADKFDAIMDDIYRTNKMARQRADALIQQGLDQKTAVEEVLAEMAQEVYDTRVPENKIKMNILQKVINAVRQFLKRIGVPLKRVTDSEILGLISNARQAVVKGERKPVVTSNGKPVYSVREKSEVVKAAAKKALQKKKLPKSQFEHVSDDFYNELVPVFAPEKKTIIDKIEGMQNDFWKKLAQGIADQYRSIKDISEDAYIKARMSKTVDGALEGVLFNGEVKLTDGALDIAKDTKGLFAVLEPVGNEVDSYQIWVALNREHSIYEKSRRAYDKIDNIKGQIQDLGYKRRSTKTVKEANKISDEIEQKKKEVRALQSSVKGISIDPEIVAKRNMLSSGTLNGRPRIDVYKEVQKGMNKLNRSVLNVALKQGTINKEAYEIYANDINFIPFYKVMEETGDVQAAATKSGLVNQYFSKALKGGEKPFGDLMENTLRNWSHILSSSMKNEAANATLRAAVNMGAAQPNLKSGFVYKPNEDGVGGKVYTKKTGQLVGDLRAEYTTSDGSGLVKTMIDGRATYFKVTEPLLLESIMSIGYMGPKSKFLDVARGFKNVLQFGVTLAPGFKVRNLFRDSVSAMAVTDLKKNPFANVIDGWVSSDKNNPAHISALAGGGIFNFGSAYEGDQAKLIKRLLDSGVKSDTILDSEQKIKKSALFLWNKYQEWGNKSEAANRIALYKQLRESGASHLEASFQARDMLDFSMQGAWPAFRYLTQIVPFLNARVQGLYKLGRDGIIPTSRAVYSTVTGKDVWAGNEEKKLSDQQKATQFSVVMGAVALASLALYMAFKDDEEFKKREQWDRDNFWWFKLPGMDDAYRIPKPFEVGAFGTMAERTAEQIFDKGAEGKAFEQSLKRMLTDTFAINLPQIFKPLVDLYANKDSFTGAPIETAGMERLSKEQRIAEKTSPLAIGLSKATNVFLPESTEVSPVQTDYAIKSYFGWLGGTASWLSNYAVMPFSKSAYPNNDWKETMSMGFVKSLPATQSRYVTAFYENNKEISQAYADMRHFAQLGEADKVQEILKEKGDKIAMAKFYDNASKDMSKMRQVIQAVRNDENMTGAQKKEEIDRMKVLIGEVARQMEEARIEVKKQYAASQ